MILLLGEERMNKEELCYCPPCIIKRHKESVGGADANEQEEKCLRDEMGR